MINDLKAFLWETPGAPRENRQLNKGAIYLLLVVVALVLGLNWPIMATGLKSVTPIWMGVFRVVGAGLVFFIIVSSSGNLRLPPARDLPVIASLAIFRLAGVFILVFTALQLVPAGRSSVVVWTTSLWTVPIAAVFLGEKMSGRRWVGLMLGISGVIVLFEPWSLNWDEPGVTLGHGLLILAAISLAFTSVHIRGHRWTITPLESLPWQLTGAAIVLVLLGLAVDGIPEIDWTAQLVGVVLYQGLLASGIAFWAQIVVMRNLGAVSANLTLTAVPVVGVVSSAWLLGESITTTLTAGLILIVLGVALNLLTDHQPVEASPRVSGVI